MKKANELKKLRRENRALRRRIRDLEQHGASAAPVERTSDAAAFDASNYFSYLLARLRQKSLFARAEKITRYFRSSIWVTRLFRYGMLIYQYLQAGAFVLLYTALFILIIPIVLSLSQKTPKASVLVVSPFFFRPRGFGEREDMYVCWRDEGENAVILRKYFFFYLRRRMRHAEYFSITETVLEQPKEDTETPC